MSDISFYLILLNAPFRKRRYIPNFQPVVILIHLINIDVNMKDVVCSIPTIPNEESIHGNGEALPVEESPAKQKLRGWLNRHLKIKMTDGRVLTGAFLCTDRDANVILGSCSEFLSEEHTEARALGLVMVPGRHIVTIHLDT